MTSASVPLTTAKVRPVAGPVPSLGTASVRRTASRPSVQTPPLRLAPFFR